MDRPSYSWLYVGLLLAVLLLVVALGQMGYLETVRGVGYSITAPIQAFMSGLMGNTPGQTISWRDMRELQRMIDDMQSQANQLAVENARLIEVEQENRRLRQLLNFTRNNSWYDYKAAAVVGSKIGQDPSNLLFSIFIDVGARDGVAVGMPVATDRGLVGRVVSVGPSVAEVLLLIDPASVVNGRVQSTRSTGVVRGSIEGGLVMERIPQGEEISPGDIVLTSGLGGNFPDKLVIGQITEVFQRDLDMFQSAHIRPTVDFGKLETVLVIVNFTPIHVDDQLQPVSGEEQGD